MLLYTTVPMEQIFPSETNNIQYQEIDLGNGKKVIVEKINDSQCKIVRLISTDAYDYLNPQYQPGSVINLYPF
ncbi:YlzJ-like family protein [Anaerobranca gottschalkii]|uniref:YlzJ-like protein n=1 Tax=Anaerobranca gottschalkii DSM 13577 TaxID=1120990 RepID=A0A1H9Z899_9FIRM|nr:YlzJ-like family protein [Anaerobranca gottschalkii]SES77816.1 YlzJ-like protein [Anaerobranca gottschalkii DSM 13577]